MTEAKGVRGVGTTVRWEHMFPDQLEAALAGRPVVYLTYGMCEPHGLYNAVGLDALKIHSLACHAASRHGGIVAPPSFWHIHEMGLEASWADHTIGHRNPWLTSVPPWVFYQSVWFQLRAAVQCGFRAAVVLTGHMPYQRDLQRLADLFMAHSRLQVWAGSDLDLTASEGPSDGHAGRYETSLFWALHPDLVDVSRLEDGQPAEGVMAGAEGARQASRSHGERLVRAAVECLGVKVNELLGAAARTAGGTSPERISIDEAERLWRSTVLPALRDFVSFERQDDEPLSECSPWSANQRSVFYP